MDRNYVVDRDADAQKKFAMYLETTADSMRSTCKRMLEHISDAKDNVTDVSGIGALAKLEELAKAILDALPSIEEFGEKQKKAAQFIKRAEDYHFRL